MMRIKSYEFSSVGLKAVLDEAKGTDWPVVYVINNKETMYIGETSNFYVRFKQHLKNEKKRGLKEIHVVFDDEFNKSAVLDIEQILIRMCGADGKYKLLNGNAGQSSRHNYYQREKYLNKIEGTPGNKGIWDCLRDLGLAQSAFQSVVNSNLFAYSPYTSLTSEQEDVCYNVIGDILQGLNSKDGNPEYGTTCIVNGAAGTGKTILAIYMMRLLTEANDRSIDTLKDECSDELAELKTKVLHKLRKFIEKNGQLKIGYVIPLSSMRKTLRFVFSHGKNGLKSKTVIGPADAAKESFDLLVVDETHRLPKRRNIGWAGSYDKCCRSFGLDPETTNTLDWIVKNSKHRVLFYDKEQSVKPSDISEKELLNSLKETKIQEYTLISQMRCEGGRPYIEFLNRLFRCEVSRPEKIENYDVQVFDEPNEMISAIKKLNDKHGLCRNVAGYAWKWISKGKSKEEIKERDLYDIRFGDKKYLWNMTNEGWILRKESVDEIGCIHTTQGYDLNYAGVIFGKEIDYDGDKNEITIAREHFYDVNVKKGSSPDELKRYIVNAYKIMMERGIKGCYVCACNKNMSDYLKKYLSGISDERGI